MAAKSFKFSLSFTLVLFAAATTVAPVRQGAEVRKSELPLAATAIGKQRLMDNYRNLPVSFEAAPDDSRFDFLLRGGGYHLALGGGEAVLQLKSSESAITK